VKTLKFHTANRPNIVPWPPLIYAAAILAAFLLGRFFPVRFMRDPAVGLAEVGILFAGLDLDLWAMATLWRAKANIFPTLPANALITSGVFRLTRNPIYLGNSVAMLGLSLWLDNGRLLLLGLVTAMAVDHLAIGREETHLAACFGEAWLACSARTPRWIF
jgi:protein-S-isoprenylcysteine O-methyltransferase Ste14